MTSSNPPDSVHTVADILTRLTGRGRTPAVIRFHGEEADEVSCDRLAQEVASLARGLIARGLAPGDRAAVCGATSVEWILCALAVLRAGGVVVPIDAQMEDDNLAHVLRDSRPTYLFTDAEHRQRLAALDLGSDSGAPEAPAVFLLHERDDERYWGTLAPATGPDADRTADREDGGWPDRSPQDEVVLFYTSGTTGAPKGVPLTHANLAFQIRIVLETEIATARDRLLLALPLHHVYPFVMGLLAPLAVGAPIVIPEALTGPRLLRAVRGGNATVIIGVPRLYRALYEGIHERFRSQGRVAAGYLTAAETLSTWLRRRLGLFAGRWLLAPLHRRFGRQLRLMASGGSLIDPDLAWRLEGMGWQVAIGYGLTETSPLLTLRLPGEGPLDSVGRPVPGVELRLEAGPRTAEADGEHPNTDRADEGDAAATAGKASRTAPGEVLARGPGVFHGYRNRDEDTRDVLSADGWFRTGDLGFLDDAGYLHLTGRASTLIVTEGGENVQPDDAERAYAEHPAIQEIGILERDRKLVALVVPELPAIRGQDAKEAKDAVTRALRERAKTLPSYLGIAEVRLAREALPRTRLGKVRRHVLAQRYDAAAGERTKTAGRPVSYDQMSDRDRALLENETARRVWSWLAERFPDQGLSPDTHPGMDLDIDSMAWLNLTLEIRERTGVELDEGAIARVETLRDLLQEAVDASSHPGRAADPVAAPYEVLDAGQQRWLKPPGPVLHAVSLLTYWIVSALLRAMYRIRSEGLDRVPARGPCVLTPNHTSYLDPFVLAHVLGPGSLSNTYWAGLTTAAFDTAAKRLGCRIGRGVPIHPAHGAASGLAFASAILKREQRLVWFPEGGRSADGTLQEFKPGLGKVLAALPVPVIPVRIDGAYEAWPINRRWPRPGRVTVSFGEPVDPDALRAAAEGERPEREIMKLLRERVAHHALPLTYS